MDTILLSGTRIKNKRKKIAFQIYLFNISLQKHRRANII